MTFRDFVLLFWVRRSLFAMGLLVALALAYGYYTLQAERVVGESTVVLQPRDFEQTPDYQYDGFYTLQTSERYADALVAWTKSRSTLAQVFPSYDPNVLQSRISMKRTTSSTLTLVVYAPTAAEVVALQTVLAPAMNQFLTDLQGGQYRYGVALAPMAISPATFGVGLLTVLAASVWALIFVWWVLIAYAWQPRAEPAQ